MFYHPFPQAFGIDISDLSIKIVQLSNISYLRNKATFKLNTARKTQLPPGIVVNGIIEKPEKLRLIIKKLLQGNKQQKTIRSPWVVASLPETQTFVKNLRINKSADEINEEFIWEKAKNHIPFGEDKYYIDWQITKESNQETNVLISASPKIIADTYTYLLESIGLGVIALENESLSIVRSMVTAGKDYGSESRALLDISDTRTSLIIHDHNVTQFSTSLPYSGELINTALSQNLKVNREDAEKIKKELGNTYKKGNSKTFTTIYKLNEELINEISKTFDFYYSHFPNTNKINKIVMCGGGSNLKNLDKMISSKLQINCVKGSVWKNLSSPKKIILNEEKSASYAVAIGLGLRAADNPFFEKDVV